MARMTMLDYQMHLRMQEMDCIGLSPPKQDYTNLYFFIGGFAVTVNL